MYNSLIIILIKYITIIKLIILINRIIFLLTMLNYSKNLLKYNFSSNIKKAVKGMHELHSQELQKH